MSVLRCRQHRFETKQEYFGSFNNATSVISQHAGSIGQDAGLVIHLGSKEDTQEKFLEVRLVHKSDEERYADIKLYMHNTYINGEGCWPKTLPAILNVLVNWKGGRGVLLHISMNPEK